MTDCFDSSGIIELAKNFPNHRATKFLDWFLYSDDTIDGQSKKKAYALFESGLLAILEPALTDKINDREIFMKGIDYPYYYEEEDALEA